MGTDTDRHPAGFVYFLSNPAMVSHYKIGCSSRNPYERVIELSEVTGVPSPFKLMMAVFSKDCRLLERTIHDRLTFARVTTSREFFRFESDSQALQNFCSAVSENFDLIDFLGLENLFALKFQKMKDRANFSEMKLEELTREIEELKTLAVDSEKRLKEAQGETSTWLARYMASEARTSSLIAKIAELEREARTRGLNQS